MNFILWGLIAFLIVDILGLVLYLRWEDSRAKSSQAGIQEIQPHVSPIETPKPSVPATTEPEEATVPLSATSTQPTRGEHVFTFDLAHDEQGTEHDGSSQSVALATPSTKNGADDELISRERAYLRQKASNLETRIAALNESSDATTEYQRGMRAVLEEELHATWTRLGELESESGRMNHATAK